MGRKKRRGAILKPFCYYCDREFDDEKVLIQHQKAKHFKCHQCTKKLDTAAGLAVHLQQVHKEQIDVVPNALEGRDSLVMMIHGMEGVPPEVVEEKMKTEQIKTEKKDSAKKMRVDWAQCTMAPQTMEQFVLQAQQGQLPSFGGLSPFIPIQGINFSPGMMLPSLPTPPSIHGLLQNNKMGSPAVPIVSNLGINPNTRSPLGMALSGIPGSVSRPGIQQRTPNEGSTTKISGVIQDWQSVKSAGSPTSGGMISGPFITHSPPGVPPIETSPPVTPANVVLKYTDDQISVEEKRAAELFGYREINVF